MKAFSTQLPSSVHHVPPLTCTARHVAILATAPPMALAVLAAKEVGRVFATVDGGAQTAATNVLAVLPTLAPIKAPARRLQEGAHAMRISVVHPAP